MGLSGEARYHRQSWAMGKRNCREESAWTKDRGQRSAGQLAQAGGERQRWVLKETPGSSSAKNQLETGVAQNCCAPEGDRSESRSEAHQRSRWSWGRSWAIAQRGAHANATVILLGSGCSSIAGKPGVSCCPTPWGVSTTNVTLCSVIEQPGQHRSHGVPAARTHLTRVKKGERLR